MFSSLSRLGFVESKMRHLVMRLGATENVTCFPYPHSHPSKTEDRPFSDSFFIALDCAVEPKVFSFSETFLLGFVIGKRSEFLIRFYHRPTARAAVLISVKQ